MRGRVRRTASVVAAVLVVGAASAPAAEREVRPPRSPRPWVGAEPWAGFRLPGHGTEFGPPLAAAADDLRWTGWIAVSAASRIPPGPLPPVESVAAPAGAGDRAFPDRESAVFREAWAEARAAAGRNDAEAAAAALARAEPRTAAGEGAVRRLAFATAVARNDRAAADSLFYRLSWADAGRTAARLAAWRALERGEGARAVSALEGLSDRTPGERAALAMSRWMADPQGAETAIPAGTYPPLAARALALVQAREAVRRGDAAEGRRALEAVAGPELPAPWRPVRDALSVLLAGGGGEDAAVYDHALESYRSGRDEEARAALNRWLAAWPDSPFRPQAYLLRGALLLAAGRLDEAEEDLAVARSRGGPGVGARADLVRAFVLARRGDAAAARALFDRVMSGPLGASAEAELLMNRIRLERALGDEDAARLRRLRLEEGFPDSPWPARARVEQDEPPRVEPFRSPPPAPPRAGSIPVLPADGPWGPLLFGEDALARAAEDPDRRGEEEQRPAPADPARDPDPAGAAPVSATGPSPPVAFLAVGGGGPPVLIGEGAFGRASGPVRYRAAAGRMRAGRRNDLPESDRFHWEGALGVRPGRWRIDVTGRGDGRNDDEASALGLHGRDLDTDWRGIRLDLGHRGAGGSRADAFVSRSRGVVDAGADSLTRTDRIWFGGEAELRRGGARWRGHVRAAVMDHRMPGFDGFRTWYRDLRLVREGPAGWYLGLRAAAYRRRGLLMPAAGWERPLGGRWTAWVASEPSLTLLPFRETFVANGDWQVPDLTLPAERRDLDLRGGLRWRVASARAEVRGELFRASHLRRWTRDGGLWRETAADDGVGSRLTVDAEAAAGRFRVAAGITAQRIASGGRRVPYTPRWITSLELDYRHRGWRWGASAHGVDGRTAEDGTGYGSHLRVDLETAYRWRTGDLPLGARWLELWLRVENIGDAGDPRWPGVPGPGAGVYGGVQALYGD